jgi:glycosyltransferase involved in cell wall biosynthesis
MLLIWEFTRPKMRVPSAAMSVGGIPEVVAEGHTGRLIPFGDVPALATAIRELIDHPHRRAVMGAAAMTHARQHFGPAHIVPQYEALYYRLLENAEIQSV